MSDRTNFGPDEVETLAAAFESALGRVTDEDAAHLDVDAHSIRRRVAAGVMRAAARGVIDIDGLAAEGLRALEQA